MDRTDLFQLAGEASLVIQHEFDSRGVPMSVIQSTDGDSIEISDIPQMDEEQADAWNEPPYRVKMTSVGLAPHHSGEYLVRLLDGTVVRKVFGDRSPTGTDTVVQHFTEGGDLIEQWDYAGAGHARNRVDSLIEDSR